MQCVERLHMLSLVARRIPKAQVNEFVTSLFYYVSGVAGVCSKKNLFISLHNKSIIFLEYYFTSDQLLGEL